MKVTVEALSKLEHIGPTKAELIMGFCKGDPQFLNDSTTSDLMELGSLGLTDVKRVKKWLTKELELEAQAELANSNGMAEVVKKTIKSFDDVASEVDVEALPDKRPDVALDDSLLLALGPDEEKVDLKKALLEIPIADGEQYIVKKTFVDTHTVFRKRVRLTPAVCNMCAFDICEHHNLGIYEDLPPETKLQLKQAIRQHKILYHPTSSNDIVSASQMLHSNLSQ